MVNWWLVLVVGLSAVGVLADFCIKLAGNDSSAVRWGFLALGMLLYVGLTVGWFFAFRHVKLGTLAVYFSVSTVLLLVLLGVWYFGERLSPPELVGIAAAILGLVLLGRFI